MQNMNQTLIFLAVMCLLVSDTFAQSNRMQVPMNSDQWSSRNGEVAFIQSGSREVMHIQSNDELLVADDVEFTNGTIEFDVLMEDNGFSIYFRRENDDEAEVVYFRAGRLGNPTAHEVLQYTPVANGVLHWNVHGHYQGPAQHTVGEWNRVKLVISGKRMMFYMSDMEHPALTVTHLEGNTTSGGIAFEGASKFANLVINHESVEGLPPEPGFDITQHDPRYLRHWQVSEPFALPFGHELVSANRNFIAGEHLPTGATTWSPIVAERRGLINLSRRFGEHEERRGIWLRTTLHSEFGQVREVDFGFLDEVWVVVNGQLAYVDKNTFANPIVKAPKGRISIGNTSFSLPLREGENEILIGLAGNFWTWAMVARLDQVDGITLAE